MRLFCLLVCLACCINGFSQEDQRSKDAASKFESLYNAGKYNDIFAMFNPAMQAALPADKTNTFLTQVKTQAGNLKQRAFERYEAGFASYKAEFERVTFRLNIAVDDAGLIGGLFIKPYVADTAPKPERNSVKLILPFKEEWTVFWGGDTREQNYHVDYVAQKNAFDIVIRDSSGKSYLTHGKTNEDYYAFGKELIAPCDGEVVLVVDGIKDNVPGQMNAIYVPGNTVVIKVAANEYLLFAHFKQHSIVVKEGQKIKQGQLLGLCGNSGNSSEPHLHFHIQNVENMMNATGIKCYFDNIIVNGSPKSDYSPVKGERIRNK
ncbi:MAG TPA: peptidoglycan DD-metalloendopeptidase family protein [Cyclobacteriaceae bacterium]|nr:peptidoglycan DD-metalloendopeptidase family protein [Cyclobacteriaceae bacterium]HMV10417.1 peptidoglycan DD-metalloendopeptidase family protein [Cyclobacteriaceae bacterium]HMV90427.1 peptidoglycan DD-metalloendopeptidase family protein [Cyclobacteriaceae bacterium]HMX01340.1 peptidoglycan DD-metalloendopeptidase family protein [Cyclobacteriaceae bacterium]HMX50389.1 peptidoglycan DD-metalloendopeptidase family protein [Cyclobacteriaceae bacterium]